MKIIDLMFSKYGREGTARATSYAMIGIIIVVLCVVIFSLILKQY